MFYLNEGVKGPIFRTNEVLNGMENCREGAPDSG